MTGIHRVRSLSPAHLQQLWRLYQHEWWSQSRSLKDVARMVENCDVVFALVTQDTAELVAFARVLTDYVYKAIIFDVIVREDCRGAGLGGMLLDTICGDPALQSVRHLKLYCKPELMGLYARWGFSADLSDVRLMRKTRK